MKFSNLILLPISQACFGFLIASSNNCFKSHDSYYLLPQQLGEFEALSFPKTSERLVRLLSFLGGESSQVQFEMAWEIQKKVLNSHLDRLGAKATMQTQFLSDCRGAGVDTIIFLEHEPVYTLGTGSDERFIKASRAGQDIPVVRMDRGGEVTYHGPGQLTIYPILDLRGYKQDIHWYIRALEESIILALSMHGLRAERKVGITGVWVNDHKVAAVGIKCRKWVTMHGVAINVLPCSLEGFEGIVPCGLEGRKVGYINQFLTEGLAVKELSETMQVALANVFQVQLVDGGLH